MIGRLSDDAVAASVVPTLRAVHADGGGSWAQATLAQLVAILEHVERRPPDPGPVRVAALTAALDVLAGNPLLPTAGSIDERAAAALVGAVGRTDAEADAVRGALRPVLSGELTDELAVTIGLLDAFRGKMPDA
jgi:hypothetical protein